MEAVPDLPNVELREDKYGEPIVVLAFPYNRELVDLVRTIPGRRFDWDRREWFAPASDFAAIKVAQLLESHPWLTVTDEATRWLESIRSRWVGQIRTRRYDGKGWFVLRTLAGPLPEALTRHGTQLDDGTQLLPLTAAVAAAIRDEQSARVDAAAERCLQLLELGETPPPARLTWFHGVEGEQLRLEVIWDPDIGAAFEKLPGARGTRSVPLDPWLAEELDAFIAMHDVQVTGRAVDVFAELLAERNRAADAVRLSRADHGEPIEETAAALGGELAPYQWAAVHYALAARRAFLADEQGLGKTVEALATLEADRAFPAVVV